MIYQECNDCFKSRLCLTEERALAGCSVRNTVTSLKVVIVWVKRLLWRGGTGPDDNSPAVGASLPARHSRQPGAILHLVGRGYISPTTCSCSVNFWRPKYTWPIFGKDELILISIFIEGQGCNFIGSISTNWKSKITFVKCNKPIHGQLLFLYRFCWYIHRLHILHTYYIHQLKFKDNDYQVSCCQANRFLLVWLLKKMYLIGTNVSNFEIEKKCEITKNAKSLHPTVQ